MSVKFLIRRDDIVRFLELMEKDKAPEGKEWIVHLTVTDTKAFFTGGETTFDCPVHNTSQGKVKMPISSLAEAVGWGWYRPKSKKDEMGKMEWAEMTFIDGRITYGQGVSNSDSVSLACIMTDHDFYATQPEIILLSRLLDPEKVNQIGLSARLPGVESNLERAIGEAARPLARYGVTNEDIKDVVEKALKRTEAKVAESSFYRSCNRSNS